MAEKLFTENPDCTWFRRNYDRICKKDATESMMKRDFFGLFKQALKNFCFFFRFLLLKALGLLISKKTRYMSKDFESGRILVYGLKRLGDMVISIPAFELLRKRFPGAYMVLACTSYNKELIEGKYFDEIIIQPSGLLEKVKFISKIKQYGFDIGIDLTCDYEIYPAAVIYKSRAMIRVGYDAEGRGVFFTKALPFILKERHAIEMLTSVVNTFYEEPEDISDIVPIYKLSEDDVKFAEEYLNENNIKKPVIGIHPGAYFPSQRWHIQRFASAIDEIKKNDLGEVILFGGGRDEILIKEIVMAVNSIKPLVVLNEPVKRFAAFIKSCDVFLCNNSGPLHLAAAMSVPTVSIMGPTDNDLWHPLGEINIVINKKLSCSPCNKATCDDHSCMNLITVSEVMEAVVSQLETVNA
jgi:heptosyltransferase-2